MRCVSGVLAERDEVCLFIDRTVVGACAYSNCGFVRAHVCEEEGVREGRRGEKNEGAALGSSLLRSACLEEGGGGLVALLLGLLGLGLLGFFDVCERLCELIAALKELIELPPQEPV